MNELAIESFISQEIKKFTVTDAAIAELRDNYLPLKINGLEDKHGYLLVRAARLDVKAKRIEVDKMRKQLNENALKFQKSVNGRAKEITVELEKIEHYLGDQESWIDSEKERLVHKKIQEEADELQSRINILLMFGFQFNGVKYIAKYGNETYEYDAILLKSVDPTTFNEQTETYRMLYQNEQARIIDAKKAEDEIRRAEHEILLAERNQLAKERAEIDAEKKRLTELNEKLMQESKLDQENLELDDPKEILNITKFIPHTPEEENAYKSGFDWAIEVVINTLEVEKESSSSDTYKNYIDVIKEAIESEINYLLEDALI